MTEREMYLTAINTVIKYAEEQGVKLRRMDFDSEEDKNGFQISIQDGMVYKNHWYFVRDLDGKPISIMVKVSYTGKWEKQLKIAKDRFLNYYNARLEQHHLSFSFTANELDILAVKKQSTDSAESLDSEQMELVFRRINKLLALSDQSRNNSEQEAIAASLQVQKLLAKYNLSLADVTGEIKEESVEQSIADVGTGKKWKYTLADAIADNFACKNYIVGHEQIVFYGYKADIVAARRVFVYLFKVGDKLATQYAKKYREENYYADGVYNSFCKGFVAGVRKALERQSKALAIIVQPKVQKEWEAFSADFGVMNNSGIKANNREAYDEGFVEGKRAVNAQYLED